MKYSIIYLYPPYYNTVCQRFATGRLFSPGTPVSSTNKTDRHDIAEILLKVALSTITQTPYYNTSLLRGQYT
jgi:hypothetical protein